MEHLTQDHDSPLGLFQSMRRLTQSRDLVERAKALWLRAALEDRLTLCSDNEISDLVSAMQRDLEIFSAEFVVCEHAKQRLQRSKIECYSPGDSEVAELKAAPKQLLHFFVANEHRGILSFFCESQPLATVLSHGRPKRCPFCQQENPVLTSVPTKKNEEQL